VGELVYKVQHATKTHQSHAPQQAWRNQEILSSGTGLRCGFDDETASLFDYLTLTATAAAYGYCSYFRLGMFLLHQIMFLL